MLYMMKIRDANSEQIYNKLLSALVTGASSKQAASVNKNCVNFKGNTQHDYGYDYGKDSSEGGRFYLKSPYARSIGCEGDGLSLHSM